MRSRRPGRHRADEGFALITTVLVIAMLAAFSLVVLQQTLSNTALSKKDQDWVAALGAAQAGVDDYLSRLNDTNGGYYVWTTANPDPANPAMGFTGGAAKWAPVPTAGGEAARGSFHYDVDTTGFTGTATLPSNGNIVVSSTGRVGARSRTLTATVRRSGFVDYVYFTDYETRDPLTYTSQAQRDAAVASCSDYYGARANTPTCTDIAFSNDTLNGPVHSNDTMLICGNALFKDTVTTGSGPIAANGGKRYRSDGCGSTSGTSFQRPEDPTTVTRINLPATNLGLKAETGPAASPRGCLYVGPTKVVVRGTQIKVTSPWTKTVTPGCAKDAYFTIPVNGVVYVDVVPAEGTPDPNSWGASEAGKPTCPSTGNNVGYPVPTETDWTYPCKAGDVFIEQQDGAAANALQGRLTVSANNNLYVTNHLDYAGGTGGNSFLGLIAEQFLYVWHPVNGTGSVNLPGQSTPFLDARISAALLSLNHAITVQHYNVGSSLGTLNITGALIQKFRGIVRSGGAGYAKNYVYDQRLRYDASPKFLNPTISSFGAVRTAEARPQYR
jgi:Tfp pilus assembly protein PilX